ncbi:MAG: SDR family oxidoreductase [Dehalococcoidia bacterium]|jgi:NAD(P)-dependent dehydrogenase (short-subunit alcohol dehydrogenase family)
MPELLLHGKVAVITGSTSGIGRAGAIAFAREGARVVISGRNQKRGGEVVAAIEKRGGQARFVAADMTATGDIERLVNEAVSAFGRLDIYWHNAGIMGPDDIDSLTQARYDEMMDVNLKAGVFGVQCALPQLRKKGGAILFTSSVAGLKQSGFSVTYSLAKTGLVMLTRKLAVALAKDDIRVNCLCPGRVQTGNRPLISQKRAKELGITPEEWEKRDKKRIPLGRFITEEEVADAALFLVSEKASGITGVALPVDGGFLAV